MFEGTAEALSAVLLDIQGTLLGFDGSPVAGGAEAVARLRDLDLKVRFVTNVDSVAVATILERLQAANISAAEAEIFSPISAAKHFLERQPRARCQLLVPETIEAEFEAYRANGSGSDWVIVGDCREGFTYARLNEALGYLRRGAELLALQKGRWFPGPDGGPVLDTGAFVSALEYGAEKKAYVVGKPSTVLLRMAIEDAGVDPYAAIVVGDDVDSDVPGAHAVGARSVLVRTGKFSLDSLERSERKPDILLDSVADLPSALVELVR